MFLQPHVVRAGHLVTPRMAGELRKRTYTKKQLCIVYVHRNRGNGKLYVGLTPRTPFRLSVALSELTPDELRKRAENLMQIRWKGHIRTANKGSRLTFHKALRKYGPTGFDHEVLEVSDTHDGASLCEQFWIAELKSMSNQHGYNDTSGGDNNSVRSPTAKKRHKENTRKAMWREDVRNNHLEAQRDPRTKQHKSSAQSNRWDIASKRKKATWAKSNRLAQSNVNVRTKKSASLKRWHQLNTRTGVLPKRVQQLTLAGDVVAEYASINDAAKALGIDGNGISRRARGLGMRKDYAGYLWRFVP